LLPGIFRRHHVARLEVVAEGRSARLRNDDGAADEGLAAGLDLAAL
jgi:hypothetical protein